MNWAAVLGGAGSWNCVTGGQGGKKKKKQGRGSMLPATGHVAMLYDSTTSCSLTSKKIAQLDLTRRPISGCDSEVCLFVSAWGSLSLRGPLLRPGDKLWAQKSRNCSVFMRPGCQCCRGHRGHETGQRSSLHMKPCKNKEVSHTSMSIYHIIIIITVNKSYKSQKTVLRSAALRQNNFMVFCPSFAFCGKYQVK